MYRFFSDDGKEGQWRERVFLVTHFFSSLLLYFLVCISLLKGRHHHHFSIFVIFFVWKMFPHNHYHHNHLVFNTLSSSTVHSSSFSLFPVLFIQLQSRSSFEEEATNKWASSRNFSRNKWASSRNCSRNKWASSKLLKQSSLLLLLSKNNFNIFLSSAQLLLDFPSKRIVHFSSSITFFKEVSRWRCIFQVLFLFSYWFL